MTHAMLSNVLFKPGMNQFLAKLDDSKSMFSVAFRDGLDSSGRTVMEYKRDPHGGRERLIEEVLTLLIWGFGINLMKNKVYDPLAKRLSPVKNPALDMDLLMDGPQKLTSEMSERFRQQFPGAYDSLHEVVKKPRLQRLYHKSNVAKFLIATGIPVALIAFGVPTFNQWLTRKKVSASQAPGFSGAASRPAMPPTSFVMPSVFQRFSAWRQAGVGLGLEMPSNRSETQAAGSVGTPKFSGWESSLAMGASKMLQNERYNTLLVDGVLSGGRTYKARNWVERAEVLFREGSIVFFLYFAQGALQKRIGRVMDRLFGSQTGVDFKGAKFLRDRYGNRSAAFQRDLQKSLGALTAELPGFQQALNDPARRAALEAPLTRMVREYALKEGADNLIFETAKATGWIKTRAASPGRQLLDLSQKVQTSPMLDMAARLDQLSSSLGKGQGLDRLLKRAAAGRFSAWMLANAVCALFLSYICPKIQHWITYKYTGQSGFPGVES